MLEKSTSITLSPSQAKAAATLYGEGNVFLTGEAGSGKSFVIREFLKDRNNKTFPSLASTGAAAVLIGGRTFHSFMGLGIFDGGPMAVIERAAADKKVRKRLNQIEGMVVDEISMLSGEVLATAEQICRIVRDSSEPWGGLRIIAVGDFAQLPPVIQGRTSRNSSPWAFQHDVWERSNFTGALLEQNMRTQDAEFLRLLNQVRWGQVSEEVSEFLDSRLVEDSSELVGTRMYPRREQADQHNQYQLNLIDDELVEIATEYMGAEQFVSKLKQTMPIPDVVRLKKGAYVMLRVNDPRGRFVNGSTGHVQEITDTQILVELVSGRMVAIEKSSFQWMNGEGIPVAAASNFPLSLAYAVTIHKAQGLTLDQVIVDLTRLWEAGQAYVALSRVKRGQDLYIEGWDTSSIRSDNRVKDFYNLIQAQGAQT
jgi:ATP-dependent DNA helicase PIF1